MPAKDHRTILRAINALVSKMQTAKSKKGVRALFAASPAQLGAAAVKAAKLETKDAEAEDCVGSRKRRRRFV